MKHLIIFAHPNQESLNAMLQQTVVEHLTSKGHEVQIRDLYALNFNPVLSLEDLKNQGKGIVAEDVKIEQEFITWADSIILIYPIWWTGLPAILKGYIDRVFSYGFAYRYDLGVQKGLLFEKQTTIINTIGKSLDEYHTLGMDKALSLTADTGIYTYCGLKINQHLYFDKVHKASKETIESWKEQLKSAFTD